MTSFNMNPGLAAHFKKAENSFCEAALHLYTLFLAEVYRRLEEDDLEMSPGMKKILEASLRDLLLQMNPHSYLESWDTDTDEMLIGCGMFRYRLSLIDKGKDEQEAICTSL